MTINVEIARHSTDELLSGVNRLLPQLSSSASPVTPAALEDLVRSPGSSLIVARNGESLVGMLTLVTFEIPTGLRAWIEDVVVDEQSRGLGVGVALTEAAVDEARRRGARSIDLTSRPTRVAANSLYQKMGFVQRETNVYRFDLD